MCGAFHLEKPSKISRLENRTKTAQSGGLERSRARERMSRPDRRGAVWRFVRDTRGYLGFIARLQAAENISGSRIGGGRETEIQHSLEKWRISNVPAALQTTVPNAAPMAAVSAMANAPQNVTRAVWCRWRIRKCCNQRRQSLSRGPNGQAGQFGPFTSSAPLVLSLLHPFIECLRRAADLRSD